MRKTIVSLAVGMAVVAPAWALNTLQLDVIGGTYNPLKNATGYNANYDEQTTVANAQSFVLRALLCIDKTKDDVNALLAADYYISAALEPKTGDAGGFGSFTFDGTKVHVTSDMDYGTPPLSDVNDVGNLPTHGMFQTYYSQFEFNFDSAKTVQPYNVQDDTLGNLNKETMYYVDFTVNTTTLSALRSIHFDLYSIKAPNEIGIKAPFSHDAQSLLGGGQSDNTAPDGGTTLALLGLAMIGIGGLRQRFVRK